MPSALILELKCLLRLMRRQWLSTAAAILGLAVATALTVATVTVAYAVFDPQVRGVAINGDAYSVFTYSTRDEFHFSVDRDTVEQMQRELPEFEHILAVHRSKDRVALEGADHALLMEVVSPNYFAALGVRALAGRLDLDEQSLGLPCVLSPALARQRFGSEQAAIGQLLRLNQHRCSVLGVVDGGFEGLLHGGSQLWIPWHALSGLVLPEDTSERDAGRMTFFAVLALTSLDRSSALAAFERYRASFPYERFPLDELRMHYGLLASPDAQNRAADTIWVYALVAALVLLVALSNGAAFTTMLAMERIADDQVRSALGAPSLLLRIGEILPAMLVLGFALALGMALMPLVDTLVRSDQAIAAVMAGTSAPQNVAFGGVMAVAIALLSIGLLVHFICVALWRSGVGRSFRGGSTRYEKRLTVAISAVQVVFALLAAVAATQIWLANERNAQRLQPNAYAGIDTVSFFVKPYSFLNLQGGGAFNQELRDAVGAALEASGIPRAQYAFATRRPFDAAVVGLEQVALLDEEDVALRLASARALFNDVSNEFYNVLGITLLAGRLPAEGAEREVAIDSSLAEQLAPEHMQSLLGRQIASPLGLRYTITGLVSPMAYDSPQGVPTPSVYRRLAAAPLSGQVLVDAGPARQMVWPAMRAALAPDSFPVAAGEPMSLARQMREARASYRARTLLVGVSALVAMVLAGIGIQATTRFWLIRELRELSIRAAIGEQPVSLFWRCARHVAVLGLIASAPAVAASLMARSHSMELASLPAALVVFSTALCALVAILLAMTVISVEFFRVFQRRPIAQHLAQL